MKLVRFGRAGVAASKHPNGSNLSEAGMVITGLIAMKVLSRIGLRNLRLLIPDCGLPNKALRQPAQRQRFAFEVFVDAGQPAFAAES